VGQKGILFDLTHISSFSCCIC